jgi:hypothetical protein
VYVSCRCASAGREGEGRGGVGGPAVVLEGMGWLGGPPGGREGGAAWRGVFGVARGSLVSPGSREVWLVWGCGYFFCV